MAEYTLPFFSVTVNVPSQTSFSDGKVPFEITAAYTVGDPVEGRATVEISTFNETPLRREINLVDGQASFELDIERDLNVNADNFRSFNYIVVVTDSILNLEQTVQGNFRISPYKYQIQFSASRFLAAPSNYSFEISVTDFDNLPAPEGKSVAVRIEIFYNDRERENEVEEQELSLDGNGRTFGSISIEEGVRSINIRASSDMSSDRSWFASTLSGSPGSISLSSEETT